MSEAEVLRELIVYKIEPKRAGIGAADLYSVIAADLSSNRITGDNLEILTEPIPKELVLRTAEELSKSKRLPFVPPEL
jgi:hypothetical protein